MPNEELINWLHISDWHQKYNESKEEKNDRSVMFNRLLEDIKSRKNIDLSLERIDFVVFSGDLSFHGREDEFEKAYINFIVPILKELKVDIGRFFIVPGNHDVDRIEVENMLNPMIKNFLKEGGYEEKSTLDYKTAKTFLSINKKYALMPFQAYTEFLKKEGMNFSAYAPKLELNIRGNKVLISGLNTALFSGQHEDNGKIADRGFLVIGEQQLQEFEKDKNKDYDLLLTVMHHEFNYLTDTEYDKIVPSIERFSDLILCGHKHRGNAVGIRSSTQGYLSIHAGACFNGRKAEASRRYAASYNFASLNIHNGCATFYHRCWDEDDRYWKGCSLSPNAGKETFPIMLKNSKKKT